MPGILDRFQKVLGKLTPERTPAQLALVEIEEQFKTLTFVVDVEVVPGVTPVLAGSAQLQREIAAEAMRQLSTSNWRWSDFLQRLLSALLMRKLPMTPAEAIPLIEAAAGVPGVVSLPLVLRQVEQFTPPLDAPLRAAVEQLRARVDDALPAKEARKLAPRFDALLQSSSAGALEPGGPFSKAVFEQLPAEQAQPWRELFQLGFTCTGPRPTAKWAKEMRAAIDRIGLEAFTDRARAWLRLGPTPGGTKDSFVPDGDVPFIRALIFAIGVAGESGLANEVGDFALACYRKIRSYGPVSQAGGNACLWTLGEIGLDGVGQLGKLKMRVKYAVALRLIEKALNDAAKRSGLSTEDLEEIGVPTYDLDENGVVWIADGSIDVSTGTAVLGGKKSKEAKARAKEIDAMLAAQRLRIERVYLTDRSWPVDTWRSRLLDHPLLLGVARRLVWVSGAVSFTWREGALVDAAGKPVTPREPIVLWHPLDHAERKGEAIEDAPFKQLERETFELPHGDNVTQQFAGRRVAQHRFHALCRERGWAYRMQGEFDSINDAVLSLPKWGLEARLEVAPPHATSTSGAGIYLQVETGALTFHADAGLPPPRVLSEVMRDVALFVGE